MGRCGSTNLCEMPAVKRNGLHQEQRHHMYAQHSSYRDTCSSNGTSYHLVIRSLVRSACNYVSLKTRAQQHLISHCRVLFCLLLYFPCNQTLARSKGWIEGQLLVHVWLALPRCQLSFWGKYTNRGGGPICLVGLLGRCRRTSFFFSEVDHYISCHFIHSSKI